MSNVNSTRTPAQIAERLQRRRTRVILVEAILFIGMQANFLLSPHHDIGEPWRRVDMVRIPATLVWTAALLLLVGTGGAWFRSREIRSLLDDESTIEHRRRALSFGFWAAMLATMMVYALALVQPLQLIEALHIILSFGIGASLIRFAVLERRAARG
jgi:hypothetical protein